MKIVADITIPFLEGVFEPYAEVVYKEGPLIERADIIDADALIVRTRTKCDCKMLRGTKLKIIATATSSTEHIDINYCEKNGIFFKNAVGSNAGAVANYVFSALYGLAARRSISLSDKTIGIIGLGSTGQRVEEMGRSLGFKIIRHDPRKAEIEWYTQFHELDYLLENSDIVTLHLPLTAESKGLANAEFFAKMKPGAFFINTAQGDVVVEDDLIEAIPHLGPIAIDTWSHEPVINTHLMNRIDIATPHIAGYSMQAKQIGSAMAVRSVARFLGIRDLYEFYPKTEILEYQAVKLDIHEKTQGQIASMIQYNYPIFTDDFMFRMNPTRFEQLRTNYQYRREFYL